MPNLIPLEQAQKEWDSLDSEVKAWANARWKCRTDLFVLATEVLGFDKVRRDVHGHVISTLQQFPIPGTPAERWQHDRRFNRKWEYTPWKSLEALPGTRRRLIQDFRSSFKTTINVVTHTIQWLLNYPDICILIIHAKLGIAEDMLANEIRMHFLTNTKLRQLFPEFCPNSEKEAGNREKFYMPNRTRKTRREASVQVASIEAAVTGYHFDVLKFTDIVGEINSQNREQLQKVAHCFGMYRNVLVQPNRWIDVEGTRYHFDDLYGRIIDAERERSVEKREWNIYIRGCYKKDTGGKPYTFLPEELDLPFLKDEKGDYISWFPQRFPLHELEKQRLDTSVPDYLFHCQMLNNPINSDAQIFPMSDFRTKTREEIGKVVMAFFTTTVDLAETDTSKADFTVITTCGWDNFGRGYVVDIRRGRFMPDVTIQEMFDVHKKYNPLSIKVEETGFMRGLKTSIRRLEDLTGRYLPIISTPRDNQAAKEQRIQHALQPWYRRGELYFQDDIACLDMVKQELSRFPKSRTDDILDTLADQFQDRDWLGRQGGRPRNQVQLDEYVRQHVGRVIKAAQEELMFGVDPII